jgi:phosphopantetheinyl transferase
VEPVDGRALRVARAFLSDDERAVLASSPGLTHEEAAVRAWSAKECYGKALGVGLGKVIERARIRAVGGSETCIEDHQRPGRAVVRHAAAVGHLFSLLGIEQTPRNAL